MLKTTANKITMLRVVLVPVFMVLAYLGSLTAAFIVYVIACLSDFVDGYIARHYNQTSDFGKFADPLADKILVISAFACFIDLRIVNSVFIILVLFREFTVTSIRLVAAESGKVVAANMWGKAKTVSQMIAIIVVLINCYIQQLSAYGVFTAPEQMFPIMNIVNSALLWISAVLTVISGIIYIKDNFKFIKNAK